MEILQLRTTNSNQSGASQELIQAKESEIAIHKKNAEEKNTAQRNVVLGKSVKMKSFITLLHLSLHYSHIGVGLIT